MSLKPHSTSATCFHLILISTQCHIHLCSLCQLDLGCELNAAFNLGNLLPIDHDFNPMPHSTSAACSRLIMISTQCRIHLYSLCQLDLDCELEAAFNLGNLLRFDPDFNPMSHSTSTACSRSIPFSTQCRIHLCSLLSFDPACEQHSTSAACPR